MIVQPVVEPMDRFTALISTLLLYHLLSNIVCRWVVTAAHCVHGLSDKEADDVWVRVGDHDNSDPGDTQVEHQHPAPVSRVPQFWHR